MSEVDPLAVWRRNPFFVLEVKPDASRAEFERAGQKLLALLEIGSDAACRYQTPLGLAERDADAVRQALAMLRDPGERALHELWARVAPIRSEPLRELEPGWDEAERALGWKGGPLPE